jgi:uncharacterized protein
MSVRPRLVFDTNVLVSAMMLPQSKPRLAWNLARRTGVVLASHETLEELDSVLRRPKLARYIATSERIAFLDELARVVDLVQVTQRLSLCRDPRDDKFLELAYAGRANLLLTGDADLLVLHPFRGTAIVTPAAYLA